jgi:hypothetical protein
MMFVGLLFYLDRFKIKVCLKISMLDLKFKTIFRMRLIQKTPKVSVLGVFISQ